MVRALGINQSKKGVDRRGRAAPRPRSTASRTQRERSAETQARLLDATIACLIELGYARTSTTAICERAGVSRGAQLHHYPTKAQLVSAAIEYLFSRRHREFRQTLTAQPDLAQAFAALWEIYTGDTLYAWMELLIASRTDESLRAHLRQVDDRFFEEAELTCQKLLGLDATAGDQAAIMARLILSVFDGLSLNYILGGREQITSQVRTALTAVLAALIDPERQRR